MHRCYDIFRSGQDRCAALEAGLSPATTNGENRGDNSFSINIDCNDCNDNDIIVRGGGGNNSDDNVDNNNDRNINNNNNLTIVNHSFLGVMNDNCGDDIVSKGIDVGDGENINENGDNNDNNNFNIFNNNNKQLKNVNHSFIADDNYGDKIDGKGIDDNNCGDEIDGQRIDDNNGAIGIGGTAGNNSTDRMQQ
ncbi:hypothetical protein CBR_g2880 [Chara braunii]|uniref:Uncharacterized protein n=1 Tax=Chara braunii TaxID=69332 RepID=A0A388KEA4_CHABU|nr:hypothetical protein CBR_g2880 [Chara braunii]|eukprot:GBG68336.1 hypothetical protein CBR_g2880 [Chara braunii]